jgi:hypothetical protein
MFTYCTLEHQQPPPHLFVMGTLLPFEINRISTKVEYTRQLMVIDIIVVYNTSGHRHRNLTPACQLYSGGQAHVINPIRNRNRIPPLCIGRKRIAH